VLNRLIESQRCKCPKRKEQENSSYAHFLSSTQPRSQKHIILKNFKLLQNDKKTSRIFSQPPLIKRDKNIGNFLVQKGVLKSDNQPGTFKCPRKPFHSQCRQNNRAHEMRLQKCYLLHNMHFMKKIYTGETRRRQATVSANTYKAWKK